MESPITMPLAGLNCPETNMAMDPQQRAAFVDAYTRLLITTWSSEEFASRVDTDLRGALAQVGIEVPAGATLERVRDIPEVQREGGLDVQVEEWERGMETNHFSVHIRQAALNAIVIVCQSLVI